jgi:hypothetical protein
VWKGASIPIWIEIPALHLSERELQNGFRLVEPYTLPQMKEHQDFSPLCQIGKTCTVSLLLYLHQ